MATLIAESFSKLEIHINLQSQEDKWSSNNINQKKYTPRHIIIKCMKTKRKACEKAREKCYLTNRKKIIQIIVNISSNNHGGKWQ